MEYDEPRSLEEDIKKLNHCYEKLKLKYSLILSTIEKGMRRLKENGLRSKEDLRM